MSLPINPQILLVIITIMQSMFVVTILLNHHNLITTTIQINILQKYQMMCILPKIFMVIPTKNLVNHH